jgi:hypothetical protein
VTDSRIISPYDYTPLYVTWSNIDIYITNNIIINTIRHFLCIRCNTCDRQTVHRIDRIPHSTTERSANVLQASPSPTEPYQGPFQAATRPPHPEKGRTTPTAPKLRVHPSTGSEHVSCFSAVPIACAAKQKLFTEWCAEVR